MKNIKFPFQILVCILCLQILATKVLAQNSSYEEVSYDDLVNQISSTNRNYRPTDNAAFEQVKLHFGAGYVSSFSQLQLDSKNVQRYQNGLQLSLGIDLFSRQWFGETSFRNFGITNYGSEEIRLREFDLKMGYIDTIQNPLDFRIMGGLTTRYLQVHDGVKDIHIDDTTPGLMIGAGLAFRINPVVSLGFDIAGRSALIGQTADKSSIDFTFDLRASL